MLKKNFVMRALFNIKGQIIILLLLSTLILLFYLVSNRPRTVEIDEKHVPENISKKYKIVNKENTINQLKVDSVDNRILNSVNNNNGQNLNEIKTNSQIKNTIELKQMLIEQQKQQDLLNKLILQQQQVPQQQQKQEQILNIQNSNNNNNNNNGLVDQLRKTSKANPEMLQTLDKLERFVHIDLKGAPPKANYFETFIPLLKKYGATGILIEYEDMFPFEGALKVARHGNAYTIDNVKRINELATANGLKLMPLVQTYGHLEWLLKHKDFAHLRDHADYPQVITPCLEESYKVIFDMLDQVIKLYPDVPFFHIGCDEVYYKLVHSSCNTPERKFGGDFSKAFMSHVTRVASYVRSKIPNAKIIIWDDMLHSIDEFTLMFYKNDTMKLEIEPMIWAYVENVETWFQDDLYRKYGNVFPQVWSASAYKGASGEVVTVTSIEHHYLNHITWNNVMHKKQQQNLCKFRGIALTGWSRYDHFLTLCDLLPEALPSLVYNLITVQTGELNDEARIAISKDLGCGSLIPWKPEYVGDGRITCKFPGHEVYEAILPISYIISSYKQNMEFALKYITPVHVDYNYMHKSRAREVLAKLHGSYSHMVAFKNQFIKAGATMYWDDTIYEWLDVYFMPDLRYLHNYLKAIKKGLDETVWHPRPFPYNFKDVDPNEA